MDKHTLTEADIRTKFITPAIVGPSGGPSGGRTVGPGGGGDGAYYGLSAHAAICTFPRLDCAGAAAPAPDAMGASE